MSAQDISLAHRLIDTLTSNYFEGRGAVNDGEKKAANFIANQFNNLGLKSFKGDFLQPFNYPINTIYGELSVQLDDELLTAGRDYIVGGNSGGINGTFKLVWYSKDHLPTKKKLKKLVDKGFFLNKFIIVDDKGIEKENEVVGILKSNKVGAEGVILLQDKLTKGLSTHVVDFVVLKILRKSLTEEFKIISLEVNQKLIPNYQSQNVIGFIEGTETPDSLIVISAHYDHLGRMGDQVYFPGANDNASGVAMLLNLATYYTKKEFPKKTIVFMAFGAEESGIIGSKHFVEHPMVDLSGIRFQINLDLLGTGSEGIMVVNGAIHPKEYGMLQTINKEKNYLKTVKKRGKAANSDHYWFTEKGVPAFFIYTLGGIKAYHDVDDIAKTLPLTEFEDCFRLICDFIEKL